MGGRPGEACRDPWLEVAYQTLNRGEMALRERWAPDSALPPLAA